MAFTAVHSFSDQNGFTSQCLCRGKIPSSVSYKSHFVRPETLLLEL